MAKSKNTNPETKKDRRDPLRVKKFVIWFLNNFLFINKKIEVRKGIKIGTKKRYFIINLLINSIHLQKLKFVF